MTKEMDKQTLLKAIGRIFSQTKLKKELRTTEVARIVAEYLGVSQVSEELTLDALRDTDFAIPRPKLRGSSYLAWVFVHRPGEGTGRREAANAPARGKKTK